MAKLILSRHGESEANKKKRIAGQINSPLTKLGEEQADELGKLLNGITLDHCFTSDLQRAVRTAEITLNALGQNLDIFQSPTLRERSWGIYEDKSIDVLDTPELTEIWQSWSKAPENGESYADIYRRSVSFLIGEILPLIGAGSNVLMVTHNGVGKCLQMYLERCDFRDIQNLHLPNCGVKVYEFDGKSAYPKLLYFI